ncbi:MAG: hypothetical protein AB1Z98_32885 [Nannocystaceae bacterium]
MLSLPQVLHEAQRHSVLEIAIEPGQPVTFHGEQGALVLGESLDDGEISDALAQVLAPEQMAELAVASMVEFHVGGYSEWNLVAETGADGVMIRGRIRDGSTPEEYGTPLDLPPLRPFDHERTSEIPRASASPIRNKEQGQTRWDLNTVEEGAVMEAVARMPSGAIEDPTLAAARSGPIGLAGTLDGFPRIDDAEADEERSVPRVGARDELQQDEGVIDFALVGRAAATVDIPVPPPSASTSTSSTSALPAQPAQARGTRPTMRGDDTLAMHVDSLTPGTVVYLAGVGAGARLLEHFEAGYEVLDDGTWATITTRPLSEIPMGQAYLIRMEDPSRCLPWLLRRLEEGACVVVETRSRTPQGARRVLLGAEANPQLVRWLDAHRQRWLHADGVAWLLEPLGG